MIEKTLNFLVAIAVNGIVAIFVTVFVYVLFCIVFLFAMIPISIMAGEEVARSARNFVGEDLVFRIIYSIVFISMVMDDFGIPNIKTFFKRWKQEKVA